jgi:hypothetical protein
MNFGSRYASLAICGAIPETEFAGIALAAVDVSAVAKTCFKKGVKHE